jgi:pyruvate dehydrogenase E2 component (dihydrolipoyllysine-residue acetyltransferase)
MPVSVVMPALEMAQETGKLVSWKKKEGEQVKKGEMLLEVETDKAVVEIEAGGDGVLSGVTAKVGDIVPVGQTIAWLLKPGESVPTGSAQAQTGRKMDSAPAAAAAAASAAPEPVSVAGAKISPKARRLAREHGVDISRLKGSGPGGEILADDILKAAQAASGPAAVPATPAAARPANAGGAGPAKAGHYEAPAPTPAARPVSPPAPVAAGPASSADSVSSIGRIMAERTTQSWTTVPHFFVARDVDATALNATREGLIPVIQKSHGVKITHTDLIVSAVGRALKMFPRMNGGWVNNAVSLNADINVALAMAVENAVVTAVIRNADKLPLGAIAKHRKELSERAKANKLQPADISGATFTISNLGMFGVDAFTAIIVPPQAGILAVGAIMDRVVAIDGMIGIRPMVTLTLSSDHRIIDGARAAQFMQEVVGTLSDPGKWLA